ncbi:hypothetical protein IAU60_001772 [Kwoniella sp. DSM 27419]
MSAETQRDRDNGRGTPRSPQGESALDGVDARATVPEKERLTPLRVTAHYAILVLASMLGCLARLGLDALATYDGHIIFPLAWAQGVGCGVMGLALARKTEITAIYPPLYTFLATGIAGSITTFSSWMLGGYLSFSNFDGYDRKGLHDAVDGVAYSLSTLAIAISSLYLGEHVASLLPSLPRPRPANSSGDSTVPAWSAEPPSGIDKPTRSAPASPRATSAALFRLSQTPLLDTLAITSAALSYLVILLLYFLGPAHWRHDVLFPLLLSPPGTFLRYWLSNLNTTQRFGGRFPIGTFLANMIASLLLSGVYFAQRLPQPGHTPYSPTRCSALYAIQQGFCGCLSTVSTFVSEVRGIRYPRWKWFYLGTSVVLGHLLVMAVIGGSVWSGTQLQSACMA